MALNVRIRILKLILDLTGSQGRSFRIGLMWFLFLTCATNRAVLFGILWSSLRTLSVTLYRTVFIIIISNQVITGSETIRRNNLSNLITLSVAIFVKYMCVDLYRLVI